MQRADSLPEESATEDTRSSLVEEIKGCSESRTMKGEAGQERGN
jgi:hypothetical protein